MEQTFGTWSSEGIGQAPKCRVGTGTQMKNQRLRYTYSPQKEFYFYKTKMTMNLKITEESLLSFTRDSVTIVLNLTMHTSSSWLSQLLRLLSFHPVFLLFPAFLWQKQIIPVLSLGLEVVLQAHLELRKSYGHCGRLCLLPSHQAYPSSCQRPCCPQVRLFL